MYYVNYHLKQRKTVTYRKLTDIDTEEMAKHIKATSGSKGNLDERVKDFNNALTNSLNAVAPLQTKQITVEDSHMVHG